MNLRPSIIKTLSFFSIFSQPLSFLELQRWLWTDVKTPPDELWESLHSGDVVKESSGFFFLSSANDLMAKRSHREFIVRKKMCLARRAAYLISWVPFVKLVALCNSVSFGVAEEASDIDLFIIVRQGRIWTARFCVVLTLKLFGLYRNKKNPSDKVCSSFFLTDDNLDIHNLAIPESPDVYLIYWITQLVPLINREVMLEKFWQANGWVKNFLANFDFVKREIDENLLPVSWLSKVHLIKEWGLRGKMGNFWEIFFKKKQLKKIWSHSVGNRPVSTAVIVNDRMLKFHEEDRRLSFQKKWLDKIKEYEIGSLN